MLNDFNSLKNEVESIKNNQSIIIETEEKEDQNFSLYNKDREVEEKLFKLIQTVDALQQKVNNLPSEKPSNELNLFASENTNDEVLQRLESIEEKISVLESILKTEFGEVLKIGVKEND